MKISTPLSQICAAVLLCCSATITHAEAPAAAQPWMDTTLPSAQRAALVVQAMTLDEKLRLVYGYLGADSDWKKSKRPAGSRPQSAGYIDGVQRLGIPPLYETDAGLGVASQPGPDVRQGTALPSGLSTAASWDTAGARAAGAMIGDEARKFGFNVLLAGGVNLLREPRNGRNFEYAGEDPLLAGRIVGAQIAGIQSQKVVATLKHYALNDQETNRTTLNVKIDDSAARMSDLLALQLAYEDGQPGSVMCGYNRVNGAYSCENSYLLNTVLKQEWGFKGWVMSDWGATHSTIPAANAGLDQQSGMPFDLSDYFGPPLKEAVLNGWVPQQRLDDMARRIVGAMFEHGVVDHPVTVVPQQIDFRAHAALSQHAAQEGMVLLKNRDRLLPLADGVRRIAVIGGYADKGVMAGGGSSLVYPQGGNAVPDLEPKVWPGPVMIYPSSPYKALQRKLGKATLRFDDGRDPARAAALARDSDVVLVFATQWTGEGMDVPDLALPKPQDALIHAVTAANPRTVVVLETGGPVTMPWLEQAGAVLEAWYPGTQGGEAIASVLTGEVNPSGRLPMSFPVSEAQLPRPKLDGYPEQADARIEVDYHEGAAVGYKWFDLKQLQPLFPFGYGLSYTEFAMSGLRAELRDGRLQASFEVRNTGKRAGKQVAQIYVAPLQAKWESPKRLGGFSKVSLAAGARATAGVTVDPRLLASFDSASKRWIVAAGDYRVTLAAHARDAQASSVVVHLDAASYDVQGRAIKAQH